MRLRSRFSPLERHARESARVSHSIWWAVPPITVGKLARGPLSQLDSTLGWSWFVLTMRVLGGEHQRYGQLLLLLHGNYSSCLVIR